jgi:hypothetical protein
VCSTVPHPFLTNFQLGRLGWLRRTGRRYNAVDTNSVDAAPAVAASDQRQPGAAAAATAAFRHECSRRRRRRRSGIRCGSSGSTPTDPGRFGWALELGLGRVGPDSDRVGPDSDRVGPDSDRVGPDALAAAESA